MCRKWTARQAAGSTEDAGKVGESSPTLTVRSLSLRPLLQFVSTLLHHLPPPPPPLPLPLPPPPLLFFFLLLLLFLLLPPPSSSSPSSSSSSSSSTSPVPEPTEEGEEESDEEDQEQPFECCTFVWTPAFRVAVSNVISAPDGSTCGQ